MRTVLDHFGSKRDADDRLRLYGHLADAASRLYVASMTAIEVTTLATSLGEWSRHVPEAESQLGAVRRFVKTGSERDLVAAMAKGLAGNDPTGELPWKKTTG